MLVKTRGIVLNFIKFRETSIIVRIYTEQLGLQSYIINSVRKKSPGSRMALFQPFTLPGQISCYRVESELLRTGLTQK